MFQSCNQKSFNNTENLAASRTLLHCIFEGKIMEIWFLHKSESCIFSGEVLSFQKERLITAQPKKKLFKDEKKTSW